MATTLGSCVKLPLDTYKHKLARVHINIVETTESENIFERASHEIWDPPTLELIHNEVSHMKTDNVLIQVPTGCVEPTDLNQEINGAGTQCTLFCTNLSYFHHNLHHLTCPSCSASQSGANWLIARASYVGRREPTAGVAKGGYGKEGGGYNGVSFFHWWILSWPGLDTHLFELGPYVKLQCALMMRFITNSPNHSTSMQKDLNKLIWRESHAIFK